MSNMEKDIGRLQKNPETDIVIRIDDFGGRVGLTIREFANSETYKGFTKSGTRISAENFAKFKELINSIDENDLKAAPQPQQEQLPEAQAEPSAVDSEDAGLDADGLM
jgi:hypothetical protein